MSTGKSTTQQQHSFAQIPRANIQRSKFNRSCNLKTAFDVGLLIPIFRDEVLPGDTMSLSMTHFCRMATPLHPTMDNMFFDTFFFFVPNRLVWENWARFNGQQDDPGDSTDFLIPVISSGAPFAENSLEDYMGFPTKVTGVDVSALWNRAYNTIWNEWFRSQDIQDSVNVPKDNGPDTPAAFIQLRGKTHDYFTACLPFPQKGPAVELPLGTSAPVVTTGDGIPIFQHTIGGQTSHLVSLAASTDARWFNTMTNSGDMEWNNTKLVADLSQATSATINAIREAFQIQRLYERDARGGTRLTEVIRSHFGVESPDQRQMRPEYLGGGSSRISISSVPQTSEAGSTPQGTLAGYGISTTTNSAWTKSFTEHGMIIGLASVRADITYQQGVERMDSRRTRWDFFWPSLAHLGEQAVLQKEIFADGSAGDDLVFGYQERYAEYRYKPSRITGDMRSNHSVSLDTWHLGEDFSVAPTLDEVFIEVSPPIARIIAVPSERQFLLDVHFNYTCARPMPTYSVPGLIDHF